MARNYKKRSFRKTYRKRARGRFRRPTLKKKIEPDFEQQDEDQVPRQCSHNIEYHPAAPAPGAIPYSDPTFYDPFSHSKLLPWASLCVAGASFCVCVHL